MKIMIVNRSDLHGGAARAAHRLHQALLVRGYRSTMLVTDKRSKASEIVGPEGLYARAMASLRPALAQRIARLQRIRNPGWRSLALFPSGLVDTINRSDADVINLHWIGEETLSVAEIGAITKPVVWTLHDMWPFCGAEHYEPDDHDARWRHGYQGEAGVGRRFDLDAWVWRRKRQAWRRPFHLVAPSRWLADCARGSPLMRDWPLSVIPNPLDLERFQPGIMAEERQRLGISAEAPVVICSTMSGADDKRKGWDLLVAALELLAPDWPGLTCLAVGPNPPCHATRVNMRCFGYIDDDAQMARLYRAADVAVVPSRQDNLPQTATEAQACGCPVVAFAAAGMPDAVEHRVTGYLAEPYIAEDLARGIAWVLSDRARERGLRAQARARALRLWSADAVIPAYLAAYAAACEKQGRQR